MAQKTPKKVTIGAKVHPETKRAVKRAAKAKGVTPSGFIEAAVVGAVEQGKKDSAA